MISFMKKIPIFLILFLTSCVYDNLIKIITIKNNSKINICIIYGGDKISDDRLFYGTKYSVKAMSSNEIFGRDDRDTNLQRTFYFFNEDTVYKRIKSGVISGIVEKSFIKKYTLNIDSLKSIKYIVFP